MTARLFSSFGRWLLGPSLALSALALPLPTAFAADDPKSGALLHSGLEALKQGAPTKAIEAFELSGDRGVTSPDLSYDRALAYLLRAKSPQALPGDLGQAVAALEEVLLQNPEDLEAERVLGGLRAEIARRRSKAHGEPVSVGPRLGRAAVGLAPRAVWDGLAVAGSILATLGLLARALARRVDVRLAGGVVLGMGALLLLIAGPLGFAAGWLKHNTEPAVVITADARLLDEQGVPHSALQVASKQVAIPEGSLVFVHQKVGNLIQIEWGSTLAWITSGQLRMLGGASGK